MGRNDNKGGRTTEPPVTQNRPSKWVVTVAVLMIAALVLPIVSFLIVMLLG